MALLPGETPNHYRARKTCGDACRRSATGTPRSDFPPKHCSMCGAAFTRRGDEAACGFHARKTCGPACAAKAKAEHRRTETPAKYCLVCGVRFVRRANEVPHAYRLRRSCGKACGHVLGGWASRQVVTKAHPYPTAFNDAFKDSIRRRDGWRCRLCGQTGGARALHIHHVNYDKQDIAPTNLVSLCASCHSKTHTKRAHWRSLFEGMVALEEGDDPPR